MKPKILKFLTGEEIVCEAKFNSLDNSWQISSAIQLVFAGEKIALVPWGIYVDKDEPISVNEKHILYVADASEEITEQWVKFTNKASVVLPTPSQTKLITG